MAKAGNQDGAVDEGAGVGVDEAVAAATDAATSGLSRVNAGHNDKAQGKAKRVKIVLAESDDIPPGGQFIGVNGTGYMLRAGVEAEVPEFILEVLDNAVTTKPVLNDDGQVIGYREVPRFPYRKV